MVVRMPSQTVDSNSPLKLTAVGDKVSKRIDSISIVKGLATDLRVKADGKLPYDIQELCFNFIRDEYKPSDEVEKDMMRLRRISRNVPMTTASTAPKSWMFWQLNYVTRFLRLIEQNT